MARGGRPRSGGGKPSRNAAPARLKQTRRPARGPARRRRGFIARAGQRGVALTVLATAALAIAGVAIAGAIGSSGNSGTNQAASTSSTTPSAAATKSTGPLGPTLPGQHATPQPSPHVSHPASPAPSPAAPTPSTSPPTSPSPTASAKAGCPSATGRVAAARRLLQHQEALPTVSLRIEGPRQGLLGAADAQARTLTLYVRGCSEEPTLELAVVWGYEAGQFIHTETWGSATKSKWNQLRGSSFSSDAQFKQDAASVFAFWQTGSTQYWQSPVAPPSYSRLSQLVPYLKAS